MTPQFPIVDCHQHFWRLGQGNYPWLEVTDPLPHRYGPVAPLLHDYLPADYRRETANFNVVATVHMEAEWNPADPLGETRWLHDLAETNALPSAIIGQAWFARDDISDVLAGQASYPLVRGVREKPTTAPAPDLLEPSLPGSMSDPAWRRGYALLAKHDLHYELQTRYWHLSEAATLAHDFPNTAIVLNHAGMPDDRSEGRLAAWRAGMEELATQANVSVKISGIGVAGQAWSVTAQETIVQDTIRIFGIDRCMFASNFPPDRLTGSFATIFNGFLAIIKDFSDTDRHKLFHDNAVRIYRL